MTLRPPSAALLRWLPHALVILLLAGLTLAWAVPAEAYLTYSLYSALKKSGCSGDTDGDCLDNSLEDSLAWAISPWYFYDEDEGCNSGLHFDRRDYIQVRPHGTGVSEWSGTDGVQKWVTVTFFFLYPHDCGGNGGLSGHLGDSERVYFNLYSYDIYTWYLASAYYDHHGKTDYVSGSWLEQWATVIGTNWASITADEDKHGSWPGYYSWSDHCAGSMDNIAACAFGTCDCFQTGSWQQDYDEGRMEIPSANRNIGGPSPESWLAPHVTVSGTEAYTALDVGHGLNKEYWTPRSDKFKRFCGWECEDRFRLSDGSCYVLTHNRFDCADGPLSEKVDTYPFTLDPPPPPPDNSCIGDCGGSADTCWCDAGCVANGDCCWDACTVCGHCSGGGNDPPTEFLRVSGGDGGFPWHELAPEKPAHGTTTPDTVAANAAARPLGEPARRALELAATAADDLRRRAARVPDSAAAQRRWLLERAEDPVAALVPMLHTASPRRQLTALRWAAGVSHPLRLAALFEDLGDATGLERGAVAAQRVGDLIALLESRGVTAEPTPGLPVAWIDRTEPTTDLRGPGEEARPEDR